MPAKKRRRSHEPRPLLAVPPLLLQSRLARQGCALILALLSFACSKTVQRLGPPPPAAVETQLTVSADRAAAAIRGALGAGRVSASSATPFALERFRLYVVSDTHAPVPNDFQMRAAAESNPPLARYASLPAERRRNDLFLYEPTGDYYWTSDYAWKGRPVKFRCAFLVHLEAAGEGHSTVEVIQYQPTVWMGDRFGFSAHAVLPGFYNDLRPVAPTTRDSDALLGVIRGAASANP
jgi:hypothetical protein